MSHQLREIPKVKQSAGSPLRRWWTSDSMDLYVWQGIGRELTGFEICYGKPHDEHSLRWSPDEGFRHHRIDDGEETAFDHRTPIAVPDGDYTLDDIAVLFEHCATEIDSDIFVMVRAILR
ncbi:MAG: hypothetical protein AAF458_01950 [Pseudomonadota bacterium]